MHQSPEAGKHEGDLGVRRENQARWDDDEAATNRPLVDVQRTNAAAAASVARGNKSAMKYKS